MAIRSKSRKKENSSTANETKRQPFGLIADGASRKTNSQKRTKERRKSRQIGDDVVLYIQERNSKKKTLHRATMDPKTGGITYTPTNRKTPIAYDRHRHTLIETTPDGDQIELELDCDEEKENIDSTLSAPVLIASKTQTTKGIQTIKVRAEESSCAPKEEKRITRRETGTLQPTRSYAESTDPESSSSSDDEESDSDAVQTQPKSVTNNNRNIVAASKTKGKIPMTTKERSDDESDLDEPPVKKSKFVRAAEVDTKNAGKKVATSAAASKTMPKSKNSKRNNVTVQSDDSESDAPAPRVDAGNFSSPIVKSDWEEQPDWRCTGAIDY